MKVASDFMEVWYIGRRSGKNVSFRFRQEEGEPIADIYATVEWNQVELKEISPSLWQAIRNFAGDLIKIDEMEIKDESGI